MNISRHVSEWLNQSRITHLTLQNYEKISWD